MKKKRCNFLFLFFPGIILFFLCIRNKKFYQKIEKKVERFLNERIDYFYVRNFKNKKEDIFMDIEETLTNISDDCKQNKNDNT